MRSPVDARRKLGQVLPRGGRGPRGGPRDWRMPRSDRRTLARPVGRGRHTGLLCNTDPALARDPRCMAKVPATERGRGDRFVAAACKRQHMGTVAGHRGTGVPRGTAAHLDKRRPVPRPATAKVASGIAETARGQLATGPEWASGQWAAGERSHGQENIGAVQRPRRQDGNRGSPAVISLSVSVHLAPLPRPLCLEGVWRGKRGSGGDSRLSHLLCRTAGRGEQRGC